MICGQAQIVGLAPSLGAPSITSYILGLPALWPDDSIGMDSLSPGDPAVSLRHSELTTARCGAPNEVTGRTGLVRPLRRRQGIQRPAIQQVATSLNPLPPPPLWHPCV